MSYKVVGVSIKESFFAIGFVIYRNGNNYFYAVLDKWHNIIEFRPVGKVNIEWRALVVEESFQIGSPGYHFCYVNNMEYVGTLEDIKTEMTYNLFELLDRQSDTNTTDQFSTCLEIFHLGFFLRLSTFIVYSFEEYMKLKESGVKGLLSFPIKNCNNLPQILKLSEVTEEVDKAILDYLSTLLESGDQTIITGTICLYDSILYFGNYYSKYENIEEQDTKELIFTIIVAQKQILGIDFFLEEKSLKLDESQEFPLYFEKIDSLKNILCISGRTSYLEDMVEREAEIEVDEHLYC